MKRFLRFGMILLAAAALCFTGCDSDDDDNDDSNVTYTVTYGSQSCVTYNATYDYSFDNFESIQNAFYNAGVGGYDKLLEYFTENSIVTESIPLSKEVLKEKIGKEPENSYGYYAYEEKTDETSGYANLLAYKKN